MSRKTNWLPWLLVAVLLVVLFSGETGSSDHKSRNLLSRLVNVAKVWLLFRSDEEPPAPLVERRYTTDEWHSQYANRTPKREIGADGYPILKHGDGL